ncbi:hypothetical protein Q5P01_018843 [Channa striata]|uniref:Immunoglobulin V-set domain-containing protein n=1 Tax=Channa striata TaxID=64152 RepID=A0AA88M6I7_CHASR|nr:hypothetical protein Q5P01_018843 [Channa striata]
MATASTRPWFFLCLQSFLTGGLVDSSSLSSAAGTLSISATVGGQVVLPCSWKSRLGSATPSACHIQWADPVDTVFEQWGEQRWQSAEFEGRVEVPEEKLESGDCSLIISDVQVRDTGRYESFMVLDGARSQKTRTFIQSVKLSVFDHKSLSSLGPGEDLVLELYTSHSMRVIFMGRNSSEWSNLWTRDDNDTENVEKHPLKEQLTVKKLRPSHEGTYKVLDEQGLTISTVRLSVAEKSTAVKSSQVQESPTSAGDAVRSSCSAVLVLLLLLVSVPATGFRFPHLL